MREPVPPYLRIAGEIRGQIERGELLPGEQIPSIVKLSEEYEVSRGTARRAQQQLLAWGLVVVSQGWGVFVAERPAG